MHWKVKGVIQKALSTVPGGVAVNDFLQRSLGGLQNFEANVDMKVTKDWAVFMAHLKNLNIDPRGLDFFEIGTGWYPTLPVCFSLAGAGTIRTYDLNPLLKPAWTFRMVQCLAQNLPLIAEAAQRPLAEVAAEYERLRRASTIEELFAIARIEYRAPADASASPLPDGSVDILYSNSVLEHVYPDDIASIMRESYRLLRPGGMAIHSANCGDHYAYFDRHITAINYLRYSSTDWEFWQNKMLYQNRLRPDDLLQIALNAGFTKRLYAFTPKSRLLELLPSMPIAPEFQRYTPEQLCSTSVDFVVQRGA